MAALGWLCRGIEKTPGKVVYRGLIFNVIQESGQNLLYFRAGWMNELWKILLYFLLETNSQNLLFDCELSLRGPYNNFEA